MRSLRRVGWTKRNAHASFGVLVECMSRCERPTPERRRAWRSAALLGGVSVAVAVFVFAPRGCELSRGGAARVIRSAVQQWQASAMSPTCPTYADLVGSGLIDPGVSRLAGADLLVECSSFDVSVVWAGPDRRFGTLDDETAPDPLGRQRPATLSAFGLALPLALVATLSSSLIAIVATLLRSTRAGMLRRLGSIAGWLVVGTSVCAGLVDMTVAHIAATRPGLSRADAERSRARGNQWFFTDLAIGVAAGLPGMILMPFRRRSSLRSTTKSLD